MTMEGLETRRRLMWAAGGAVHAPPRFGCQLGTKQLTSVHFRWGAPHSTDEWFGRVQKQHCPRFGQVLMWWLGRTSQHL